eukprot:8145545-Ditylum_brightwellii.AAC.1
MCSNLQMLQEELANTSESANNTKAQTPEQDTSKTVSKAFASQQEPPKLPNFIAMNKYILVVMQ